MPARSCGGPGQRSHRIAAERRDPAEPLVGLEHPVALDAAVDLGALAELVEQVHLVPARDAPGRHPGVEQLVGAAQQRVQRLGGVALLERAVGQLGEVPGGGGRSRANRAGCSQAWPTLTWVTTSKVRPRASATVSSANGSRLPPSREVGRRTPLAIALSLPIARRDQGQDAIRLAEVEARQDDRVGRVAARDGHRRDGTTGRAGPPDARPRCRNTGDPSGRTSVSM